MPMARVRHAKGLTGSKSTKTHDLLLGRSSNLANRSKKKDDRGSEGALYAWSLGGVNSSKVAVQMFSLGSMSSEEWVNWRIIPITH